MKREKKHTAGIAWGISTLGCPELSLTETAALADRFGIFFLELRALENSLDLVSILTRKENQQPLARLSEAGRIHMLDSNYWCCDPTEESFRELCRLGELADRFRIPYVRIFGSTRATAPTADELDAAKKFLNRFSRQFDCTLVLETHDLFSAAADCAAFIADLSPRPGTIWDVQHTLHAGETLEESFRLLRDNVVSLHVKDWTESGSVIPGRGAMPWLELRPYLDRLAGVPVMLESEKMWEPELPALEELLPHLLMEWN